MDRPFLRLAVVGDPVAHSRSPALHEHFLTQAGIAGSYERIRIARGEGAREFARLRDAGYYGVNVTTPMKEEAFAFARTHDALARSTGSVNTLIFSHLTHGANTDGAGVLGTLADAGLGDPHGAKILVLGAGATARSAVATLSAAGARPYVWNRSRAKISTLLELGAQRFDPASAYAAVFAALAPESTIDDSSVLDAVRAAPFVVDANYGERATLASLLQREVVEGEGMLEHSARASFELWLAAADAEADARP